MKIWDLQLAEYQSLRKTLVRIRKTATRNESAKN